MERRVRLWLAARGVEDGACEETMRALAAAWDEALAAVARPEDSVTVRIVDDGALPDVTAGVHGGVFA
jgi:hypothetical protein